MFFPPRSTEFTGSDLAVIMSTLAGNARDAFVLQQVKNGCVPNFMRVPQKLELLGMGLRATLEVAPDFLCLGTDEDFIYAQCDILTAQYIADICDASLPTRKIGDAIWNQANERVHFIAQGPPWDATMASSARLLKYSSDVFVRRKDLTVLCDGAFKYYILDAGLSHVPPVTCIYGGRHPDGTLVQGANARDHIAGYVDYSQCPRLVSATLTIGDDAHELAEVLSSRTLYSVVDYSPSKLTRVPGVPR